MSNSNHRNKPPLNAPKYFTDKINRLCDDIFELRRLSNQRNADIDLLFKKLNTCGAFYQQLLEIANREKITWNYYKYQHENINKCLRHIKENLQLKQQHAQIQQSRDIPGWVKALGGLVSIADGAMSLVGLPPFASHIFNGFVNVVDWFRRKQLGGSRVTKYLPSSRNLF